MMREMQDSYEQIFSLFGPKTRKVITSTLPEEWRQRSFWSEKYEKAAHHSILVIDDCLDLLEQRSSGLLSFLSHLVSVGARHYRISVFVLVQGNGSASTSQKLRSLLRQFSVFFIFGGLNVTTARWLASFLSPGTPRFLLSALESLPRSRGQFILVDTRLEMPLRHRFSAGQGLLSQNHDDRIFAILEP